MSNFCSLPRNPRWRRKGDYEWQIWISIYEVKATVLSLLSCIFVMLDSQRLRLDMFRLFPSSKPQLTTPENTITYHNTVFVGLCIGHCLQILSGVKMAPRETEDNAYAKLWSDQQTVLWYYLKEDHHRYVRNLCSCEKKAWKKFGLVRDSNPWPLRYRCSALFFSGYLFATAKVAYITAMIFLQ